MLIQVIGPRAAVLIHHEVAYYDEGSGLWLRRQVGEDELVYNIITNGGRDFIHTQAYQTTGLGANGLNYIGLSNDGGAVDPTDTTLTGELSGSGLTRAQGTVGHTAGTNTTQVQKVFTYGGGSPQGVQKSALFTAGTSGTMAHEVLFTQRTLNNLDSLTITYTITLG